MSKYLLVRLPYRQVSALCEKAQAEYILPISFKPNFVLFLKSEKLK